MSAGYHKTILKNICFQNSLPVLSQLPMGDVRKKMGANLKRTKHSFIDEQPYIQPLENWQMMARTKSFFPTHPTMSNYKTQG